VALRVLSHDRRVCDGRQLATLNAAEDGLSGFTADGGKMLADGPATASRSCFGSTRSASKVKNDIAKRRIAEALAAGD
jgi:hypothetical protein